MKNIENLKKLYLLSFEEDTEADADFLFENVFSSAHLISEEINGKTVSMLFLMDCDLISADKITDKITKYYYLYAACTHPDYRGRGIMGKLLKKAENYAEQTGREGIILKPAKPSLFNFYENYGFKSFFKVAKGFVNYADLKKFGTCDVFEIPLEKWAEIRINLLKTKCDAVVSFPEKLLISAAAYCKVFTDNKGNFAVYEKRDNTLLCKECITKTEDLSGLLSMVKTLSEKEKAEKAEIRLPAFKNKNGVTENTYFSVISNKTIIADNPYHGFAFD